MNSTARAGSTRCSREPEADTVIRYSLICADGHEFDSWFRDSAAFDAQDAAGLIHCPFCQSTKVAKAVMAPNVARGEGGEAETGGETPPALRRDALTLDARHAQLREMIRQLREKILAASEDVGDRLPNEARRIQKSEAPDRAIRGRASLEEARALLEEGIEIMPVPNLLEGN
jgi:hypothetical protein